MRKDKCLFCTSRRCYERVVSINDNGKIYDEIACRNHFNELHEHSDEKAPGVMKLFQNSTDLLKRGQDISQVLKEIDKQQINSVGISKY